MTAKELELELARIPVSFKVVGIGRQAAEVIDGVKSLHYDCVECLTVESPDDCIPSDDDKMAVVVATDNENIANEIAKKYHDAGVLTLGFLLNPDADCYDSVLVNKKVALPDFVSIIKSIIQPIISTGYICYDFNDLDTALRDSGRFAVEAVEAESIESAVANTQSILTDDISSDKVENIAVHIFLNRQRQASLKMGDMSHLSVMMSQLPDTISVIWSLHFDDDLPVDKLRITTLMAGKEL